MAVAASRLAAAGGALLVIERDAVPHLGGEVAPIGPALLPSSI